MGERTGSAVRRILAAMRGLLTRALIRLRLSSVFGPGEARDATPDATGPAPGHPESVPERCELTRDERLWQMELLGPDAEPESE